MGTSRQLVAAPPQQGTQGGEDALTCRAREAGQPAQPGIPLRNVLTLEPGAEP